MAYSEDREFRPDEVYEDAYMRWAYELNKNLTETSKATGIPLRTLQYHKRNDRWDERYEAETAEVAGLAFTYGMNELRLGVSAAALQLVKDASNPALQHSERLQSQKLLFAIVANTHTEDMKAPSHISLIDARQVHLNASDREAGEIARLGMQANVNEAIMAQTKRKGITR